MALLKFKPTDEYEALADTDAQTIILKTIATKKIEEHNYRWLADGSLLIFSEGKKHDQFGNNLMVVNEGYIMTSSSVIAMRFMETLTENGLTL